MLPLAQSPFHFNHRWVPQVTSCNLRRRQLMLGAPKLMCIFHLVIVFIYPNKICIKTRVWSWKSKEHSALPVLREKGPGDHQLGEPEGSKLLAGQESSMETRQARKQDKFPHINPRDSLLPLHSPESLVKPLPNTVRGHSEEGQRKEAS